MIIATVNSKGGVGKSTIATHAALWLEERGVRVATVDADAQASASEWLARAAPKMRVERCANVDQLADRLPRLLSVYDVVIADGPAALSDETALLVGAADLVLLPIGPSMMDVRASYRTARLIYKVRMRGEQHGRPEAVTVLNRVQPRTRLAKVALTAVKKYGFAVAATGLHLRQAYAEACGKGTAVWRMGSAARTAANEIAALFAETIEPALARQRVTVTRSAPAGNIPTPRRTAVLLERPLKPLGAVTPSAEGN